MIDIKIEILDEDELELIEIHKTFGNDEEANLFLQKTYDSKMQNIFNKIGAGKFRPSEIMKGSSSSYNTSNPNGRVDKKPLYDIAAKACYQRSKIKIVNSF